MTSAQLAVQDISYSRHLRRLHVSTPAQLDIGEILQVAPARSAMLHALIVQVQPILSVLLAKQDIFYNQTQQPV